MADLTVTASSVGKAHRSAKIMDMIAAVAITPGQVVYRDANGKADLATAAAAGTAGARGIAMDKAGAGQVVGVLIEGEVSGFTISQAYDAPIFLSDTAGALSDTAGAVSVAVGNVSAETSSNATKILYVRFPVGN